MEYQNNLVERLKKGITHTAITGIERFYKRKQKAEEKGYEWDYLGIGAMVVPCEGLKSKQKKYIK